MQKYCRMVRKMPLEYIALFEELMEITRKITFNTVSQGIKQQLTDTTRRIIDDITFVLQYTSKKGYELSKGKKFIINLMLQSHQKRLISLIEQQSIYKRCSKCGRMLPRTRGYFYRDCNAQDGFRNDCKVCHKTIKKESYHQNKKCSEEITPPKEEGDDLISEEYENIVQE